MQRTLLPSSSLFTLKKMSILPNTSSPSLPGGPIGEPTTAIPLIPINPSHKKGTLSTLAVIFLLISVILVVVLAIVIVFCLLKKKPNGGARGPPPPPPPPPPEEEEAPEVLDVAFSDVESQELEVEAVGAGALEVEGVQAGV